MNTVAFGSLRSMHHNIALFKLFGILSVLLMLFVSPVAAQRFSPMVDMTTQDTYQAMQGGTLVLIDVRTPEEWAQTGIAQGAYPISMLDREFLAKLADIQNENPGKTVAFICASGNRSGVVQAELARRGYENMFSVYGGTTGSSQAMGWIRDGLPIAPWSSN
ncbi:MAG: rhodanese-like domain-containing protein [Devosiaceae bacterium]|nr:rhodanese-like domain-containing protein [Devosiaceae bacterium]